MISRHSLLRHPAAAVRLPPPVRPGDRVGVAALSGPARAAPLEAGLDALRDLGYEPVKAANVGSRSGLFAGDDDARLAAFHDLAADPSVRAVLFARGGHGVLRLLPRLDWSLLARYPRAYVGYSDLTPFLTQVVTRLGLVAFHGPMVAADLARGLGEPERASLQAALAGDVAAEIELPGWAGEAAGEGPFLGGCLSLLVATLGTPYAPDLTGAVLFLEDIDEPLYRLDRMLTHLELSGSLRDLRGLVAGHLTRTAGDGPGAGSWREEVYKYLRELAAKHGWPLAWGLQAGHESPNLTIPLGAPVRLDPVRRRLVIAGPGAEQRRR